MKFGKYVDEALKEKFFHKRKIVLEIIKGMSEEMRKSLNQENYKKQAILLRMKLVA